MFSGSQTCVASSKQYSQRAGASNGDSVTDQFSWTPKVKKKKKMWSIIHTCSLSPVPLLFNFPTISGLICSHNSRIPQRHYCTAKYSFYPHPQSRGLRLSVEAPIPPSSGFPPSEAITHSTQGPAWESGWPGFQFLGPRAANSSLSVSVSLSLKWD